MIYTYGYQGSTIDDLDQYLMVVNAVVVDVRLVPYSRLPWFSGEQLAARYGAGYVHIREFGNLHYRSGGPIRIAAIERGTARLRAYLQEQVKSPLLLCACANVATCHRAVVARHLAAVLGQETMDLPARSRAWRASGVAGEPDDLIAHIFGDEF